MTHQPAPHADRDHSEEPLTTGMFDNFIHPCLECGTTIRVINGQRQPHECQTFGEQDSQVAYAWWQGHDAAKASQTLAPPRDVRSRHVVGDAEQRAAIFADVAALMNDRGDMWEAENRRTLAQECRNMANAFRTYAEGVGVPSMDTLRRKRREAEAERDALRAEVARLRAGLSDLSGQYDERVETLRRTEAALAEERAKVARVEAAAHDHPDCIGECACAVLAASAPPCPSPTRREATMADLREQIAEALRTEGIGRATRYRLADAVLAVVEPAIRAAQAQAWDEGFEVASDNFVHSDYCGRKCQCQGIHGQTNPHRPDEIAP